MKTFVIAGLAAAVAAVPQPASSSGCAASADGTFTITTVQARDAPSKRGFYRRQLSGILTLSLKDGKLTDQAGRTGYIASNYQFQFDAPVQAEARESEGFGLCSNGSLSLMGSTLWYQCKSGDFYNLYSKNIAEQCVPINIQAIMGGQKPGVSQIPDGQPQASAPAVTQIPDGQPQASAPASAPPVVQIPDGQPQAPAPGTHPPVVQIPDGQPQASAPAPAPPVVQIPDGQIQASAPAPPAPNSTVTLSHPTPPPVMQIPDGQPQAPAPQPPAPTSTVVAQPPVVHPPVATQISDGQPQVTAPPAPAPIVTAPSVPAPPASNTTVSITTPPLPNFTGAASTMTVSAGTLFAGLLAIFSFF